VGGGRPPLRGRAPRRGGGTVSLPPPAGRAPPAGAGGRTGPPRRAGAARPHQPADHGALTAPPTAVPGARQAGPCRVCTTTPSTIVTSTCASAISPAGWPNRARSSRTRSARLPTSIEPVSCSPWLTYAEPMVAAASAVARPIRSDGRNGSSPSAPPYGEPGRSVRVPAGWISQSGVGLDTRPSPPTHRCAPGGARPPDGDAPAGR